MLSNEPYEGWEEDFEADWDSDHRDYRNYEDVDDDELEVCCS